VVLHILARRADKIMHNLPAPDSECFISLPARFSRLTLAICVCRRSGKELGIYVVGERMESMTFQAVTLVKREMSTLYKYHQQLIKTDILHSRVYYVSFRIIFV
jgi:hypothetical protein